MPRTLCARRNRSLGTRPGLAAMGVLTLLSAACSPAAVEWGAERSAPLAPTAVVLSAEGMTAPDSLAALAERVAAPAASVCPGSLRLGRSGSTLYAVWWAPRPDSGVHLLSARSADGGRSWGASAPVDTLDRGVTGCRRDPPAVAADSASGYVHVTYGLQAPEGPGLFFSHSMDGGVTFHAPVPILYGERLGRTSVAADGDLVVVGFEDPNSKTPRIGLAMSRTMGHIFEERVVPVSDDQGVASHPLAAVRGRRVALAWQRRASANAPAALAVRAGTVR